MSLAVSSIIVDSPEVVRPKQCKLLGAKVEGVGTVTSVSAILKWCFCLITDEQGDEHHAFLSDLKKDNVTFPDQPQPYRTIHRRVGYGLHETMHELETVPFSDLTHVDELEAAA